jgi:hypothetical protein
VAKSSRQAGKKNDRRARQDKQLDAPIWSINVRLVSGALLLGFVLDAAALFIPPLARRYYLHIITAFRMLLMASVAVVSGAIIGIANSFFRAKMLNRMALGLLVAILIVMPIGYGVFTLAQRGYGYQVPPGSSTAELLDEGYATHWGNYDMEYSTLLEEYALGDAPTDVTAFYEEGANRFWLQEEYGGAFRHYGPFKGNPTEVLAPPTGTD